ncbi:cysteine--tRNA ligase [Candidatus Falkowbacteria bacterium]|uniref:Cysteine--tRNA ligase n=1 Tax=Candidatus Buchananbacteria bacterium CG10_big_fil_rev_8_21_14_0_10_33_19 TaxID=1974525 RepID=A0A2H0W447_9BACT|nr:cysteine--tRNA ligase [Candidatus Falkowbacteria bacterium]PIS06135.1 MAG: cysteine--tRNA ligase [Candidatus Buchananbacteria bacterium CG10_big_fil_rev_8_21_14_0_10_33_19]
MLKIYNTLAKKKEDFTPIKKNVVTFYQCGPTVYWTQHIGNMRAMVLADFMVRSLEYLGYKVKMARNYTDVGHLTSDSDLGEDKMEKTAKQEAMTPEQIADKYIKIFEQDTKALNCQEPDYKPRATDYIKDMQKMVQILLDKGFAYSTDLAIYFDISRATDYTKLSGQDLTKNISEAGKGDVIDKDKRNPADFAVWFFKTGSHQNALQTWPSKFESKLVDNGVGFPGWHLECSTMCQTLLGKTVDIHMGGIEHIPVHHTNEIAQSEAANGVEFVKYWLHNEHLTVDSGKMSKSSGTAYSLADIEAKGYDPLVLRYFFLQAHYRSKQNFTWEALEAAKIALNNLREKIADLSINKIGKSNIDFQNKFIDSISDDFNMPQVLALIFEVLKSDLLDSDKLATILDFDQVLGLSLKSIKKEKTPKEVIKLADLRLKARADKNWQESDKIRDQIKELGYIIEDTVDGYKLKKE